MVKVYSTNTCHYCTLAKRYLESRGIPFENIDVSRDHEAAREMVRKTGQMGVPVLDIDGTFIVGFDRPGIDHALSLHTA